MWREMVRKLVTIDVPIREVVRLVSSESTIVREHRVPLDTILALDARLPVCMCTLSYHRGVQ
jgi:hypothetical protein